MGYDESQGVRFPLNYKGQTVYALVDPEDAPRLSQWRWQARPNVTRAGKVTGWYAARRSGQTTMFLHRFVLGLGPRGSGGLEVDHINRDKLDNRKANLRLVSHSENTLNTEQTDRRIAAGRPRWPGKRQRTTEHPHGGRHHPGRGIYWSERHGKWRARVGAGGRMHHAGYFTSELEAARAASELRRRLMPYAVEAA